MNRMFLHENLHHNIEKIINKKVLILGCGALGANLAVSLSRRGFKNFMLIDYDVINEHNFSTQPWSQKDLGHLKAKVLGDMLYSASGARAFTFYDNLRNAQEAYHKSLTYFNSIPDITIDCFDNHNARELTQELEVHYNCPVLHAGLSDQNTGEVTWDDRYIVPKSEELADPCNYPMSRTCIDLTVAAASESIIKFLEKKQKVDYFINANTLSIREK